MQKYFISIDVFESNVYLFIGDIKEVTSYIEKKYNILFERGVERSIGFAFRIVDANGTDFGYGIWLENFDNSIDSYPILAHECLHVADFILKDRKIKETEENNETLAYTFDFIFRKFLNKLKNKRTRIKNDRKKQNKN